MYLNEQGVKNGDILLFRYIINIITMNKTTSFSIIKSLRKKFFILNDDIVEAINEIQLLRDLFCNQVLII